MTNLNYYSVVSVTREEGLSNIEKGIVKLFYKASDYEKSFDTITCDIIKEILIEEHNLEKEERKNNGSKRLTKLKLKECLPEEATHVSVSFKLISSINKIENITNVANDNDLFSKDKVAEKAKERSHKINRSKNDVMNDITIWSI